MKIQLIICHTLKRVFPGRGAKMMKLTSSLLVMFGAIQPETQEYKKTILQSNQNKKTTFAD